MLTLDQFVSLIGTASLFIVAGGITSFLIAEIAIFFYDRKNKKANKERNL